MPGWGASKAFVEADLGLVEQACVSAGESLTIAERIGEHYTVHSLGVLGRIELMLGNLEAAGGYFRELPAWLLEWGCATRWRLCGRTRSRP